MSIDIKSDHTYSTDGNFLSGDGNFLIGDGNFLDQDLSPIELKSTNGTFTMNSSKSSFEIYPK